MHVNFFALLIQLASEAQCAIRLLTTLFHSTLHPNIRDEATNFLESICVHFAILYARNRFWPCSNTNDRSPTSSPKLNVVSPYVFLDALVEASTNFALRDLVVTCTNKITEVWFFVSS